MVDASRRQRVAWKTGTSYGFRDAWALGSTQAYTVGVWVGRPDGNASPQRTGRDTAAPLLFRLFELMPAPLVDVVPPAPPGVIDRLTDDVPARLVEFGAPPRAPGQAGLVDAHHDLRLDFVFVRRCRQIGSTGLDLDARPADRVLFQRCAIRRPDTEFRVSICKKVLHLLLLMS